MIFKKLTIQNFLSVRSITLDLDSQGLVLLKGKNLDNESLNNNGAGKSSIIESLVYALYGRTLRGLKGDAVVHNKSKKNMKIFLDIIDDDGTEYRIARYRKHSQNKNKSILYMNGKDITPKSEADFNTAVADLLQADYLTFTSSLLYSAESFKFTSATDSEMKSTFDVMLGLDIYQKCLEITRSELKAVENEVGNSEWKIEDRKDKQQGLEQKIVQAKVDAEEFEQSIKLKHKQLLDRISDTQEQINSEVDEQKSLEIKVDKANKAKEDTQKKLKLKAKSLSDLDELREELKDIKSEIAEVELNINKSQKRQQSFNKDIESSSVKIDKLHAKIDNYKQSKKDLDKDVGQPCPTCGSPMTADSFESAKAEYDERIDAASAEISELQGDISKYQSSIKDEDAQIKEYAGNLEELEGSAEELQAIVNKASKVIREKEALEEQYSQAQEQYYKAENAYENSVNKIESLNITLSSLKEQLESFDQDNPYESLIAQYQSEQLTYQNEIDQLSEGIQDIIERKKCLLFWEQAYSNQGIKSFILDDIVPFLNRRANRYLTKLTSGHIEVEFHTQTALKTGEMREKFSIDIRNSDGGQEYSANSGGERKRIDLAINLAMQDLVASRSNKRINIAIFDEAFDALDEVGIEKVIELLQELAADKSSIFVISHNEHLQSYFTNVLTVVKQDGYSTLGEFKICDSIIDEEE